MKHEPRYVKDYLKSFPTMEELWEENDARHRSQPMSPDEKHQLSAILQEYRDCKEQMYIQREANLPHEFHQARRARNKKRREVWKFCAEHGLPNIVVSHGNKKGLQDLDGKTILPAIYDDFCMTHDEIEHLLTINYFVCKKDGKWGVVNNHNKTRIPFEYDRIFRFVNSADFFYVEKAGKKGLIALTPYEVYDDWGKRLPKQEETMTFRIPCEMDDIYYIEDKNLFVFRQEVNGENKFGWFWDASVPTPQSFSPCIYDELYIPVPWLQNPISYEDDFFEARRGKTLDYILIWTHQC